MKSELGQQLQALADKPGCHNACAKTLWRLEPAAGIAFQVVPDYKRMWQRERARRKARKWRERNR